MWNGTGLVHAIVGFSGTSTIDDIDEVDSERAAVFGPRNCMCFMARLMGDGKGEHGICSARQIISEEDVLEQTR